MTPNPLTNTHANLSAAPTARTPAVHRRIALRSPSLSLTEARRDKARQLRCRKAGIVVMNRKMTPRRLSRKPPRALDPAETWGYFSGKQPRQRQHVGRSAKFASNAARLFQIVSQQLKGPGERLAGTP